MENEIVVSIDHIGQKTKKEYQGVFLMKKYLTFGEEHQFSQKLKKELRKNDSTPWYDVQKLVEKMLEIISDKELCQKVVDKVIEIIPPNESTEFLFTELLTFNSRVIESPDWWVNGGMGIIDLDLIIKVLTSYGELVKGEIKEDENHE